MSREIGELGVDDYLALAAAAGRGEKNAFLDRAVARHGSRDRAIDEAAHFARLVGEFARRFGADRRVALCDSPGRANLMGMHVDHRGGVVNPVATRERVRAVCARRDDDLICARSLAGDFGEGQFRISDRLPPRPLRSLGEWLNWTEHEAVATGGGRHFVNYFACGPLYAACFSYPWRHRLAGADFLLDSDLPPSSGLSSSSALVVLATDFFLRCNPEGREELSIERLLDVYGYGEWYIGTRGGTGDHAAVKLCRRGAVRPIITTPEFQAGDPALIPQGYDIVLYQSGDAANKSVEPYKTLFNAPIISYQAAEFLLTEFIERSKPDRFAELMARRAKMDPRHHRVYLGDVANHAILSEAEIYQFLRTVPPVMRQEEIFRRFEERAETFAAGIQRANEPQGGYHVRDAAAFGFGECARAAHAGRLLAAGEMKGFAQMLNVSQLGDRVTEVDHDSSRRVKVLEDEALCSMERERHPVRQMAGDYHVSTANIDRMVSVCLDCPGVLAARLSGAGLGGMVIVLGEEGFEQSLDPLLASHYYEPLGRDLHKIRIVPSDGAGVY
jgi:N-acetylgalactosamine kinase